MLDTSLLKIIFFDVGNVFVSDDPSGCFAYKCLFDRLNESGDSAISPEEFFALRTRHVKAGGGLWSFVGQYVPEAEFIAWQRDVRRRMYSQWANLSPAIKSMAEVPERLAPHYRLGILANQPAEVEAVLEERDLLKYFEILAISDKVNLHKPDPALYQWAIDAAAVKPEEAMMVGDRLDNDIVPAKSVGMRTAWLRLGYGQREWSPGDAFQKCYAASVSEVGYRETEPTNEAETPDITANSADELLQALTPDSVVI